MKSPSRIKRLPSPDSRWSLYPLDVLKLKVDFYFKLQKLEDTVKFAQKRTIHIEGFVKLTSGAAHMRKVVHLFTHNINKPRMYQHKKHTSARGKTVWKGKRDWPSMSWKWKCPTLIRFHAYFWIMISHGIKCFEHWEKSSIRLRLSTIFLRIIFQFNGIVDLVKL